MQFTLEKVEQTEKEENFGFFQGEICMFCGKVRLPRQ